MEKLEYQEKDGKNLNTADARKRQSLRSRRFTRQR